jgi:iron complex transport system permease protein
MRRPYLIAAVLVVTAFLLSVAVGPVAIPLRELVKLLFNSASGQGDAFASILYQIRLPHACLVLLSGLALGGSGAAYQGLFRNPLADPYLIGAASGAGLGAIIAMSLPSSGSWLGAFAVPLAAFLGSLGTVALVYALAKRGGLVSPGALILAGVAASSFVGALTSLIMLKSTGEVRRALSWLLGGAVATGWQPVAASAPYVLVSLVVLVLLGHSLNVMQFGDEQACQMGLPVKSRRAWIIAAASLAAGAAVAFSGVIGFVGLIVPHMVRLVWGGDYRRLIPLAALGGAVMLLLSDLLARLVLAPEVLPVGIVTALAGAPFFLWLLRRSGRAQAL